MLALGLLAAASAASAAPITVTDDGHHAVTLAAPAQRIVSLAPHATELLFAVGAGSKIVGTSDYSDYPEAATHIPSVGSSIAMDLERIIAFKPDLVVFWGSGNSPAQMAKLRATGIPVFESEPRDFAEVATSLERLGALAGTSSSAQPAADAFRIRLKQLQSQYAQRPPVKVFYQIWRSPLMTLNDQHLASKVIQLCGGENVFGKLAQLAPTVNTEAVLQANPEAIVTGSGANDDALAEWRKFSQLLATKNDNLFTLNGDIMTRGTPRILDGAQTLCKQLEIARSHRTK